MTEPASMRLSGQLLIALPGMRDHRFHQAVIYMCSHDASGAMGLIINKPKMSESFPVLFTDILDQIGQPTETAPLLPIVDGGPVDIDRGFVLHSPDYENEGSTWTLNPDISLTSTRDILIALAQGQGPKRAILGVGYAGWGPGQIEQEIIQNAWITAPCDYELIFSPQLESKYQTAVESLGFPLDALSHEGGQA